MDPFKDKIEKTTQQFASLFKQFEDQKNHWSSNWSLPYITDIRTHVHTCMFVQAIQRKQTLIEIRKDVLIYEQEVIDEQLPKLGLYNVLRSSNGCDNYWINEDTFLNCYCTMRGAHLSILTFDRDFEVKITDILDKVSLEQVASGE